MPGNALRPADENELREIVRAAIAEKMTLEVRGAGTKRGLGRPVTADAPLDLTRLAGVKTYEPEELVLTAGAATPLAEIERLVAQKGQRLAFEPPDYGPLYGGAAGRQTLAGVVAANLAGSRRVSAGAARDHFLGFRAVNGRGESFKAGGQVVKNVTGYDLCKLLAGSYGTLALLTEMTVKILPVAETEATLVLSHLSDEGAMRAMADAMGSAFEVSAAAHLPETVASGVVYQSDGAATLLRLEGPAPSVEARVEGLRALLRPHGAAERLSPPDSKMAWRALANAEPFTHDLEHPLWRLSVPPSAGAETARAIAETLGCSYFFDWGGGRIWLELNNASADAGAAIVRASVAKSGGHAVLVRASEETRRTIAPFDPGAAGLFALSKRVKAGFDPLGLFNPGRMYEGV